MELTQLSDEALLSQLAAICLEGRRLTARLVGCLIEVEERRLDLKSACTSMFDFCVRRLRMSDGTAFRHLNAARLVKRFPALLARIESGELHLSALALLRPHLIHLDPAEADELAAAAANKTHREVEELLARIAPRPDVPCAIVELPRVPLQVELGPAVARGRKVSPLPARIEPLSESRFKVQLTVTAEVRDKLERARDLMSHANPSGELAVVVERALDLLLDRLERERLGKVKTRIRKTPAERPATTSRDTRGSDGSRRAIPRAVRREVFERDGETCTFVDSEGRRCPSHARLELDHVESHARGGADDPSNLRVRCRAHNRLHAEEVFGKAHVAQAIDFRQRKSRRVESVEPSTLPTSTPPGPLATAREAGAPDGATGAIDIALGGLVNLGFRRSDARRALAAVAQRRSPCVDAMPLADVLREAIAALT